MDNDKEFTVALAGNPNVGKSTLFNALTGMRVHTGNWTGKTVECSFGSCTYGGRDYRFVDLPGTYSLNAHSDEEVTAREFIESGEADRVVIVLDATALCRNLILALSVLELRPDSVICVNLLDEAEKRGISVDLTALSRLLGAPVAGICARRAEGLDRLFAALGEESPAPPALPPELTDKVARAEYICRSCSACREERSVPAFDRILCGRFTGIPLMLCMLFIVLFITIKAANPPCELLGSLLFGLENRLHELSSLAGLPWWLEGALISGVYKVSAWVVSVMLPPMAIFFTLFTVLEDFGLLPRIAFNLDNSFRRSCTCGKQSLTMCLGFGCNAVGVTGARIIDSPRERLIAILTNCFVPCNGRFPMLLAVIGAFACNKAGAGTLEALWLCAVIVLGIVLTLIVSRILAKTILRGVPSSFTLELPAYRRPQFIKIIIRSLLDRTLKVLGRAVAVAAPAGLVIWIVANISVGGASLLTQICGFINPAAALIGLDGAVIIAFALGFPANEIVIPVLVMAYTASGTLTELGGSELNALLAANGWDITRAVCFVIFALCHWPCSTTLLTVRRETGSARYTLIAFLLPLAVGVLLCGAVNALSLLF